MQEGCSIGRPWPEGIAPPRTFIISASWSLSDNAFEGAGAGALVCNCALLLDVTSAYERRAPHTQHALCLGQLVALQHLHDQSRDSDDDQRDDPPLFDADHPAMVE
jgi:hypothetical protein